MGGGGGTWCDWGGGSQSVSQPVRQSVNQSVSYPVSHSIISCFLSKCIHIPKHYIISGGSRHSIGGGGGHAMRLNAKGTVGRFGGQKINI